MSFTDIPPTVGVDANAFALVNQIYEATQERVWLTGANAWPPTNFQWLSGVVSSFTDNGDGTFNLGSSIALTADRWYNFSLLGHPTIPRFYDIAIDDPFDPTVCIRVSVLGNTTTAFTVDGGFTVADALISNFLPSIASLVGRTFYIIRHNGQWWHERWIDWPNSHEYQVGLNLAPGAHQIVGLLSSLGLTASAIVPGHQFITGDSVTIAGASPGGYNGTFSVLVTGSDSFSFPLSSALTSPASGQITASCTHVGAFNPTAQYTPSEYKTGFELMVRGSDGALKRITITDNTKDSILFTRQSYDVSGQYGIIKAGDQWRMQNADCRPYSGTPFRYYDDSDVSGIAPEPPFVVYLSQAIDGTIGGSRGPKSGVQTLGGADCSTPIPQNILYLDFWTEVDDPCNPPDTNYTPNIFKSLGMIQKSLEAMSGFFVRKQSYEGAISIPTMTAASMFYEAGINAFITSTGSLDDTGGVGGIDIDSIDLPFTPINVFYEVQDATGTPRKWGFGQCDTKTHLNFDAGAGAGAGAFDVFDEGGKTCYISLGWTRTVPDEFMYMYPKRCFVPSFNTMLDEYQDPPTSAFAGAYVTRGASSKYKEVTSVGVVNDNNSVTAFTTDKYPRYSGDNFNDPTVHPEVLTTDGGDLVGYYKNFYEGIPPASLRAAVEASKVGSATSTTRFSITDSSKNWWPNGVLHTETGTFDSGSTTDGKDSTKSGSGFWGNGTFGSSSYLAGMIVQVTQGAVEYRRRIFNYFGTLDCPWSDALPATASGCDYQIRMPKYEKDRWAARMLQLTFPDGSVHTTSIDGNDDITLFFGNLGVDIPVGTAYQIIEYYPGGIWKWNGSSFEIPTGNDPRTGVAWHTNQTENLATCRPEYGKIQKGDFLTILNFQELYSALVALEWVKWPFDWISNMETCQALPPIASGFADPDGLVHAQDRAETDWGSFQTNTGGEPFAYVYNDANCDSVTHDVGCYAYAIGRRYSYGIVNGLIPYQNKDVDYYVYCRIPAALDGTSVTENTTSSCPVIYSFNDEGDGVLYEQYHLFDTEGPTNAESVLSAKLGSLTIPSRVGPVPIDCSGAGDPCSWWTGYTVIANTAIVRGDVSGGLRYQ